MSIVLPPARRLAPVAGVALAAAAALWWLAASRLALERGADAARAAALTLQALALARGMALALWLPRAAVAQGARAACFDGLALAAPAWPLVALAASASTLSVTRVLLVETLLVVAAALLPLAGQALGRALPRDAKADAADLAALCGGTLLAAAMWYGHGLWPLLAG
ncbi:MAG: hypothetical protein U1F07_03170 [Rubrivivax sp.]